MRCWYCFKEAKWEVVRPSQWGAAIRKTCDDHIARACSELSDGLTLHIKCLAVTV